MWKVIGRGKAGWHAKAGTVLESSSTMISDATGSTETSQNSRTSVSSSGGTFEQYVAEADEGAFVYDADGAEYEQFAMSVIYGPLLNVDLPTGYYQRLFEDPKKADESTMFVSSDFVSLDIYEKSLRKIPRIKFGRVKNKVVVWE